MRLKVGVLFSFNQVPSSLGTLRLFGRTTKGGKQLVSKDLIAYEKSINSKNTRT